MQERASQTRRAILQAAAETFETHGYVGASLKEIVTRKDVSKGALYFHFPSKQTLAETIMQEQYGMWSTAISDLRAQYPRAVRVMLELSWRVARMCRDDAVLRAGIRLVAERNLADPSVQHPFLGMTGILDELLAEARAQQDLLPDVDISEAASFMAAALSGLQQVSHGNSADDTGDGDADLPKCVTAMWRYLLPGLVTPGCLADMSAAFADLALHRKLEISRPRLPPP
jgi:AcrR family transcriptional regulator